MASDIESTVRLGPKRIAFFLTVAQVGFFMAPIAFMPTGWMSQPMKILYYSCAALAVFMAWMVTEPFMRGSENKQGLRWVGGVAFAIIYAPLWVGVLYNAK